MPITFSCPAGHRLTAPKGKAGKPIRCPTCSQDVIVPELPDHGAGAERSSEKPPPLGTARITPGEPDAQVSFRPPPVPMSGPAGGRKGRKVRRRARAKMRRASRRAREEPAAQQETTTIVPVLIEVPDEAAPPRPEPPPRRGPLSQAPQWMAADTYRPDPGKIQTVRWLALLLGLIVAFNAAPAAKHLDLETAPGWARVVLLLAALQAFYVLWMLATPDWASVGVVTIVFALVAAVYGLATVITLATPPDEPMPLGMDELRRAAPRWCGAVVLVTALGAYLCGRAAARWRRSFEVEVARKRLRRTGTRPA